MFLAKDVELACKSISQNVVNPVTGIWLNFDKGGLYIDLIEQFS